jgi:carboxylesterase type B
VVDEHVCERLRDGAVNRRKPTGGSACPNAANQVVRVSCDMRTNWVNFASTGNPGGASYDPNTRSNRVYTAEPTT